MARHLLLGLMTSALVWGAAVILVYPAPAGAQQPQDPQMFSMRMSSRIDAVQMRIKTLERELNGGESGSSEFDTGGGLLGQLDALDEQCRELEREVNAMRMSSTGLPGMLYEQQRQIEYYVWTMERQLQQIRRWMRDEEVEPESSVEPQPDIDTEEDGISDEDWAAEWAKGDR